MAIIFCPESRSFCYDKTPPGRLSMNGFSPVVIILLCSHSTDTGGGDSSQKLAPGATARPLSTHSVLAKPFCLPSHDGQVLWDDLRFVMGGRVQSNFLCVE